jgi:hypothetical protein
MTNIKGLNEEKIIIKHTYYNVHIIMIALPHLRPYETHLCRIFQAFHYIFDQEARTFCRLEY